LVIDDEESFRRVMIKFLSKQGFEVVSAADGTAGLSLAAEAGPDLILCDLNMPGMGASLRLRQRIRRSPQNSAPWIGAC
jgi:CheY-like chemotaxis protein